MTRNLKLAAFLIAACAAAATAATRPDVSGPPKPTPAATIQPAPWTLHGAWPQAGRDDAATARLRDEARQAAR